MSFTLSNYDLCMRHYSSVVNARRLVGRVTVTLHADVRQRLLDLQKVLSTEYNFGSS